AWAWACRPRLVSRSWRPALDRHPRAWWHGPPRHLGAGSRRAARTAAGPAWRRRGGLVPGCFDAVAHPRARRPIGPVPVRAEHPPVRAPRRPPGIDPHGRGPAGRPGLVPALQWRHATATAGGRRAADRAAGTAGATRDRIRRRQCGTGWRLPGRAGGKPAAPHPPPGPWWARFTPPGLPVAPGAGAGG